MKTAHQTQVPAVHGVIKGRPHQKTSEKTSFDAWVKEFVQNNTLDSGTEVWFRHRFCEGTDRLRSLENKWRKIFWSTRYLILSGSLTLPVLITASRSIQWLNPVGVVVSVLVALATGAEVLLGTGPKWRLYRQGADRMSEEGAAFFTQLGIYAVPDPVERLHLFQEQTESHIHEFHGSYLADVDALVSHKDVLGSPG